MHLDAALDNPLTHTNFLKEHKDVLQVLFDINIKELKKQKYLDAVLNDPLTHTNSFSIVRIRDVREKKKKTLKTRQQINFFSL